MNILFLDDDRSRTKAFFSQIPSAECVETAAACILALKQQDHWDYVFLDHDLGGEVHVDSALEETGMEVVRWIVANRPKIKMVIVHSLHSEGAKRMCRTLEDAGYIVARIPFAWRQARAWIHEEPE